MYFSLAWRNLWRNKKRTLIVTSSVFFAVILACIMRSAQLGSYSYMIYSAAKLQTGYLQIQDKDYWEKRSIDESISLNKNLLDSLNQIEQITSITPRLETFALLSSDSITKVASVVGTDPDLENNMTELQQKVVAGKYLESGDNAILLGEGLAKRLEVQVGDSVVLYGSGYHGQIAAAILPIKGLVKFPFTEMNNAFSYLELENAQYIFAAPNHITSAAIMIDNIGNLNQVKRKVKDIINSKYTTKTWDEMMPDLVQSIELDNASGMIMIAILYMVIAFGVFGTIMMMTSEREKEMGILNAIGMSKGRMIIVSVIESILISALGVITGILASWPINNYLEANPIPITGGAAASWEMMGIEPIMNFTSDPGIFFNQGLVVFIIALICAIYPLLFISRLRSVESMRK